MTLKMKTIQIEDAEPGEKSGRYSLEDAVELTQFGKFHVLITIATGLSLMGAISENVSVSLIMSYAKCDLKLTTSEQGLLASVSFLGIVMSSHFWGFMADTCGRQKVIRWALLLGFLCSFVSAFSINTYMMLALRFLVGLFISGVQAAAFSYVSEFHTKATGSRAASFVAMFLSAIFLFIPVVAIILIPMDWSFYIYTLKFTPWRLYIIICGSLNIIVFVIFNFLPESPSFLLQINEKEKALEILQAMYAFNTGNSKEMFPVKEIIPEPTGRSFGNVKGFTHVMQLVWDQTKPIFMPPFVDKTVKLSFIIFVLFAIGHGSFMWIPDFLVQLQNNIGSGKTMCEIVGHRITEDSFDDECSIDNKNTLSFQILFGVGVLFVTLQFVISFFLDNIGPKKLITIWLILSSISSIGIVYITEFYLNVVAIIIFTSCAACAAIVSAISVSLFTTNIRAMATCCIYMFGRLGGVVGSNLVGLLLDNNCTTIFYTHAILLIVCIGIFFTIRTKPNDPKVIQ